jgi:hypothetical protein
LTRDADLVVALELAGGALLLVVVGRVLRRLALTAAAGLLWRGDVDRLERRT